MDLSHQSNHRVEPDEGLGHVEGYTMQRQGEPNDNLNRENGDNTELQEKSEFSNPVKGLAWSEQDGFCVVVRDQVR